MRRKGGREVVVTKNTTQGPYLEINEDTPLNDSARAPSNAYVAPDPLHPSYSIEVQSDPEPGEVNRSLDSDPREEGEVVPDEFSDFREGSGRPGGR